MARAGALGILIGSPKVSKDEAPEAPDEAGGGGADDAGMGSPRARKQRATDRLFDALRANDRKAFGQAFEEAFDACMDYSGDDEDSEAGEER